ncbi:hypothetical protein [Streptomyces sp. DH8]|uniref:hypothetical protein n=1 Tax=Streptomyces sp. DH8 TaxID=2857008 RepID=UPI001E651403|nr:hypothetical protein [Streptomyces sp. DH8]
MSEKWNISDIAAAHFKTYADARTGKKRRSDYLAFVGLPVLLGVLTGALCHLDRFALYDVSKLIGGIGIFTGLLFGLLTNVFTLSLRLQRDDDLADHKTTRSVKELFANLSWAVFVGLSLVVLLVACSSIGESRSRVSEWWTAVLVTLFAHLILTVLMSLKRLWMAHSQIPLLPPKEK